MVRTDTAMVLGKRAFAGIEEITPNSGGRGLVG